MPAAELAFERFELVLEATPGTAVTPPTHVINMEGSIVPIIVFADGTEMRGTLAEGYREEIMRKESEWDASGDVDPNTLPVLANIGVKGGVTSPTTPSGATNARLWAFVRTVTADDLKSSTNYWGDPGVLFLQSAYNKFGEMVISADASSEDPVQLSINDGHGLFPAKIGSPPSAPAAIAGPLLLPGLTQLWMDTSSAIGTTEITGRLISAEVTFPNGVTYKHIAQGAAGNLGYASTGRTRTRPSMTLAFELLDATQYDLFAAGTSTKTRVRFNGVANGIETGFPYYVEADIYGKLRDLSWGDLEGSNRTVEFTINGIYDATLGSDFRLAVQNARTTL